MLKKSGAKYTILYASQPSGLPENPSNLALGRYLAEKTNTTKAGRAKCDGECLVKSTLLEGTYILLLVNSILKCVLSCKMIVCILVYLVSFHHFLTLVYYVQGIVLLIILISGLMCMMGIDTPSRFEAPQES